MSEEELLRLIEDIEKNHLHKAPEYSKELIMRKVEEENIQIYQNKKESKEKQLIFYSIRVFGAMVASLLFVLLWSPSSAEFFLQNEQQVSLKLEVSVTEEIYQKSSDLCNILNQISNNALGIIKDND